MERCSISLVAHPAEVITMLRRLVIPLLCSMCACTVIKINEGDTQTIEYEGDAEVAKDLTARACRKAGRGSAEIVSTVNKDPDLPPGEGRQVTTFRCTSAAPPAPQP
jgi:hypothetical protein